MTPSAFRWTILTLVSLRRGLAIEAFEAGHYPHPWRWYDYDSRPPAPFRSIAYRRIVRQITALDRAIGMLRLMASEEDSP